MKSTILKLTALAGVMGAGFLAVYQANTQLGDKATSGWASRFLGETFHDLAPGPEADTDDPNTDPGANTGTASLSDSKSDFVAPQSFDDQLPPQQNEPGLPSQSEPTPAYGQEELANSENPFDGHSRPPISGQGEPTVVDEPATEHLPVTSDADSSNPFADIVASITDAVSTGVAGSEIPKSEPAPSQDYASFGEQSEPAVVPVDRFDSFDPFATETSPSPKPTAEPEVAILPVNSGISPFDTEAIPSDEPSVSPEVGSAPLRPLPANDGGPSLVTPPFDVAAGPESFEPEVDRGPNRGSANISDDEPVFPDFGLAASGEFAEASNVQPSAGTEESDPFPILPGAASPRSAPLQRHTEQQPPSQPAFGQHPPSQPAFGIPADDSPGFAEHDAAPQFSTYPTDSYPAEETTSQAGSVLPPDDSVEVTIQPRSHSDANPFGAETAASLPPQQAPVETSPFGGSAAPEPRPQDKHNQQTPRSFGVASEPRPLPENPQLALPPSAPGGLANPRPPHVDFARGTVEPEQRLQPENLLGVGTVESNSPIGTQQAQVTIEKEAPPDAVIGRPLIYSIHVRNNGRSFAENVVVKDVTPRGSRLVGTSPQAELDEVNSQLVWRLGKMAPGESQTIKIKVIPTDAGQIGSIATVSFEAAVAARTVITAPKLQVNIEGPDEVRVGEKVTYRFTLTNVGSAEARGVVIRNLIPEGFKHPHGSDLEYEVGVLQQRESKNVDLSLVATQTGQYECRAILTAESGASADASQDVAVLSARLAIRRQGPAERFVGRSAEFTNTVTNDSRDLLQGITIVESVPVGVEFEAASSDGQYDPQARTITWHLRQLPPGAHQQVHVKYLPKQAAEHLSTVKAFDSRGNSAEIPSRLNVAGFSSLKVEVAHDGAPVPVGEQVALRLTIKNRGTAPANRVKTLVQIPAEMRFVDAKGPIRPQLVGNNLIEFETLDTLEIDGQQQFDIVLTAIQKGDARVRVELQADELSRPLNQEELVVIHPNHE